MLHAMLWAENVFNSTYDSDVSVSVGVGTGTSGIGSDDDNEHGRVRCTDQEV
jgi:hypothetical protein